APAVLGDDVERRHPPALAPSRPHRADRPRRPPRRGGATGAAPRRLTRQTGRIARSRNALGRLPVGRFVALLVVLTCVPLALMTWASITFSGRAVSRQAKATVRSTAAVSAVFVEGEMDGLAELAGSYAARPG